jgi:RND superfamily putative drug exporter
LPLTLRRPRATLAAGLVATVVLALVGIGVEDKLRPSTVAVPGTPSAEGEALLRAHFDDSAPFAILLRGSAPALDRQGPALVRKLRRDPRVTALSPWQQRPSHRLRPSPRKALILIDFHVGSEEAVGEVVPALDRTLEATVRPPVTATQTGFATLSRAIQDESVSSTRTAERVAVPILLLVLLLVFRSPVAAAIPLFFGAAVVISSRGLLALFAPHLAIDGFALTVASMMGLALGVDYALLMVSRFREELAAGSDAVTAARRTRATAGRTTAYAGSTLLLAMIVILFAMPGTLFLSLAGTAILVTLLSVAVAAFLAPPLLLLLGENVDRWHLGSPTHEGGGRLMVALTAVLARPRLAAGLIGMALVVLALPVLALKTGPPSASQLPESNAAREDAERVAGAIGAGWDAPFVLVAATERGPITSERNLASLRRLQRRLATDPGVQAVIGPAQIQRRAAPLRRRGNQLLSGGGEASPAKLAGLGRKLDQAALGVGRLRDGIYAAAEGAGLLANGSGRAGDGAARISAGIERAGAGAARAADALARLDEGSGRLAEGQRRAALGSRALRDELAGLMPVIRGAGLERARRLRARLDAAAARDPALDPAAREAAMVVEALTLARNQAQHAQGTAERLHSGQEKLAAGGARLHVGASRLARGAAPLTDGLGRLADGASELTAGLDRLGAGAGTLSERLAGGHGAAAPLQDGLDRAGERVSESAERLDGQVGELRRSSPGIFDSGYFLLSALDGAPAEERRRAGQLIDLDRGGQAAQVLVVPRDTFDTPGSKALNERLQEEAGRFADATGLRTGVTGGPAQLADYSEAISSRVPLVIVAISIATFLVLLLVLRAPLLAAIAVALNLLTVAVAFGILTLLFEVPAGWPLGGHSYVDSIGAAGIFGIIFGLSIDYAVFLLTRMRESREGGAGNEEAIAFGLQRTARVITGAAAIMVAVFVAFAAAPIATVSQLGTGLTVAVLLDATVVRIVLLPALMLILGERVWWLPRPLARLLPRPLLGEG